MAQPEPIFADHPQEELTEGPHANGSAPLDLLSGVIKNVRLRSDGIYCCVPESPFAISFDHGGGVLHVVDEGFIELQLAGERTSRRYERGDVVILPNGQSHVVRHGRSVSARQLGPDDLRHDVARERTDVRWLTGTFSFDDARGAQLLYGLPPLMELRGAGNQNLTWFDASAVMLMNERISPSQGSAEIMSKILELLFVHALRRWAESSDASPGWLTGAVDPFIGAALSAIHGEPDQRWTVESLAQRSNLSRSAFTERFSKRVGQPPATYLAQVRLERACEMLLYGTDSIGAIANEVGYDSQAAFSRVFTKRYGVPPSQWRSERRRGT